ncbi:MAG: hypothetical protein CR984_05855 [Proteobacteria bacterium]|nr:MAG: hypothetical protein CR984_05855 [Pseudomonadota bacterium]
MFSSLIVSFILAMIIVFQFPGAARSSDLLSLSAELKHRIGSKDSVVLADPDGRVLIRRNAARKCVPASTLKVLTSLAALHHLGPAFRYPTEFYKDKQHNLIIKGYGDPLLVSEEVEHICSRLSKRLTKIHTIWVDDSHVAQPVRIPGRVPSVQPYDAPNGGVGVNFNTVYFKSENGAFKSAESQTPLLPLAMSKIRNSGMNAGRITLSHRHGEICRYAGEMFAYFLEKYGVKISGQPRVALGGPFDESTVLVYRHQSRFDLETVIRQLLAYSNNYIANQLLLTLAATCRSIPGTVANGLSVLEAYSMDQLGIADIDLAEGSGISRLNRIRAIDMLKVLEAFKPYCHLLTYEKRQYFKTGTLFGISTRVGYFDLNGDGQFLYPFVVFMNTRGKRAEPATAMLERIARGHHLMSDRFGTDSRIRLRHG